MQIEYKNPNKLTPYGRNAKRHPSEQVRIIANSIREFGFRQPIVVDKNDVVIIGHGRLLAAKRLRLKEVPVVCADDLTDEQIRALRIADNSVTSSEWDEQLLKDEAMEIGIDLTAFGVALSLDDDEQDDEDDAEFDDEDYDAKKDNAPPMQHNAFENQEIAIFESDNYYGIPTMLPTQTTGDKFLRFMDWNEVDDPENYIAHFYYDDFKFMSAWREPQKYIERLKRFKAVIAPDFSLYTDFPRALQILSCFRRQWTAKYWQMQGLTVIPDVVWGDKDSFDYCFAGIPQNSTVAVSTVGVANDAEWNGKKGEVFRDGYNEMLKRLKPTTILFYGDMIDGLDGNIIRCPSYYEQKREILDRQKKHKKGAKEND